jgi:NAD(P)-dependent dehydrogenase (short-subunit alcohol dehydrogenase family)
MVKIKKTALVTGAAKRLGRAIALSLAENGFSIIVHYHTSRNEAIDLCEEIAHKNVEAWPVKADLGNLRAPDALMNASMGFPGSLSVLVNNASIFLADTLADMTAGDFERTMRINAWAPLSLSRAFARKVKKGSIVNILDARLPAFDRSHAAYSLSKSVLMNATPMCALEFAPGIRVNAVAPGLILPPPGKDISYIENLKKRVPLRSYGAPRDIADAVMFLVKSRYCTGEILYIDGGRRHAGYCFGDRR